jgi:hypothetical protein
MSEIEQDNNDNVMKFLMFVVLAIVYWYIRKDSGDYSLSKGIFEIIVVVFAWIAGQTVIWISRYNMPSVTVNNFSGSTLGYPVVVFGDDGQKWAIFNTGEYLKPFHGRGKLATLIVPANQVHSVGRNFVAKTFVQKINLNELPHQVYQYLKHYESDFNIEVVYFGKYDEPFIHKNPEVEDYESQIVRYNQQINIRNDLLEGRNDMLLESKRFADEMTGNKTTLLDIFKRKKESDEE